MNRKSIDAKIGTIDEYGHGVMVDHSVSITQKVNYVKIPENATNGDVIKAVFPNAKARLTRDGFIMCSLDGFIFIVVGKDWWNAPYEGVEK